MRFQQQYPCQTDGKKVLAFIYGQLTQHNFRLIKRSDTSLKMNGGWLNSTNENPIKGVSAISLDIEDDQLTVFARLTGLWPLMLLLCFGISLITGFYLLQQSEQAILVVVTALILILISLRWLYQRTITAIDNLMHNAINRSNSD